jgi:rhodanese-related sulfurtransferase
MRRMHFVSLIGLLLALAMVAAACSSDDDAAADTTTTTTAAPETTTTTTVAAFDVTAAVDEYLSAIPEGFLAIGDVQVFKDGVEASDALVIDVRETSEYAEGHIPGAVNIPIRTVTQNLDKIPMDRQVYIYCASGFRAAQTLSALGMLGYDNVLSYKPGWNGWTEAGEEVSTDEAMAEVVGAPEVAPEMLAAVDAYMSTIPDGFNSAGDAAKFMEAADAGGFVVDVRTADEYATGHIEGATNVDIRSLAKEIDMVPTDANTLAYCGSGHRAGMSLPALNVLERASSKAYGGSYDSLVEAGAPVAVP